MIEHADDSRAGLAGRALVGLALLAVAPLSLAEIEVLSTRVDASVKYVAGTSAANLSFSSAVPPDFAFFSGAFPPPGAAAETIGIVPDFTPPGGQNGDTLFLPAEMRAYQSVEGFNATRVSAAIADGKPFHRVEARTEWTLSVSVSNFLSNIPLALSLEYLLFPGEAGLTAFGGFAGEAGFRAAISVDDAPVVESITTLRSGAGLSVPTFATSGDFSQPTVSITNVVRNGLNHHVIHTEPVVGNVHLGVFQRGELVKVSYVLESWLEIPGFEVGGFAAIGDPFELASDPGAYLASQFPGNVVQPFTLTAQPAPVPLPGSLGLLLGALGVASMAQRRPGTSRLLCSSG